MKRGDIYFLIENFDGIVVVDEAYIDFSDEPSLIADLDRYPNLLVMQTFSKAWGLASLRLGMAFASKELIQVLNKIKPPYNISGLTQDTVLAALKDKEKVGVFVQQILEERSHLRAALEKRSYVLHVHPSEANFLLVEVKDASAVYAALIQEKVIVRNRSSVMHCADCLRITVGTPAENTTLLAALDRVCKP